MLLHLLCALGRLQGPDKLVLVVLNTNARGYSNLICHTYVAGKHWKFSNGSEDLTMTLPTAITISNVQEQVCTIFLSAALPSADCSTNPPVIVFGSSTANGK